MSKLEQATSEFNNHVNCIFDEFDEICIESDNDADAADTAAAAAIMECVDGRRMVEHSDEEKNLFSSESSQSERAKCYISHIIDPSKSICYIVDTKW